MPKTMFDKIWDNHIVHEEPGKPTTLYVDLHLVHEVTSAQAFEGLRLSGRSIRRPDLTVGTVDHNVPTTDRSVPIADDTSRKQIETLNNNAKEFGINYFDMFSSGQGIVHVIGPEHGYTQPGKSIVCGDSHTSTHGAFGAFALGIGTSEVEHVLATQCLLQQKPKNMEIRVNGLLPFGVTAKDLILAIIGQIGVGGGVGHVIEYTGEAVRSLSMAGRMTVCNMSIEAGARAGMIAPDETTFDYMRGRPQVPQGEDFDRAVENWVTLSSDPGSHFDKLVEIISSFGEQPRARSIARSIVESRPIRLGTPSRELRPGPPQVCVLEKLFKVEARATEQALQSPLQRRSARASETGADHLHEVVPVGEWLPSPALSIAFQRNGEASCPR